MDQSKSMIWQTARSTKFFTSWWRALLVAVLLGLNCFLVSCAEDKVVQGNGVLVSSISPSSGPVGTVVTITGAGFTTPPGSNIVSFKGKAAVVSSASDTQLEVVVPVGAETGIVSVTVDGKKADGPVFTVTTASVKHTITSATPLSGNSGTVVTINGSGFSTTPSANTVTFNNVAATVQTATATKLTVTAPAGGSTGKIAVKVNGETVVGPEFTYVVIAPPHVISSISPASGPSGTKITIAGTNFSVIPANNAVTVNDVPATIVSASATTLVITAPATGTTGSVAVTINGLKVIGPVFTYSASAIISVFAGGSSSGNSNGSGIAAKFRNPTGLAIDNQNNIYVADQLNHQIRLITPSGNVSTFSGSGTQGFFSGPSVIAQFNQPAGVAVDASGNVYVADLYNHAIRKISGNIVSTLAGAGTSTVPAFGHVDANGTGARFFAPSDVCIDKAGNIVVADTWNNAVRSVTPAGVVTTRSGNLGAGIFDHPTGVAQSTSAILVADLQSKKLKELDGSVVTTIATLPGFISDVVVNSKGIIFAVDIVNGVLYQVSASGALTAIANEANGITFASPTSVTVDSNDVLYLSDTNNHRIIKIVLP